jgi:hypothetical protein
MMAYTGIGIDGTVVCDQCGCLVADGWQKEHNGQHPHPYDPDLQVGPTSHKEPRGCLMCRLPEDAAVHQ